MALRYRARVHVADKCVSRRVAPCSGYLLVLVSHGRGSIFVRKDRSADAFRFATASLSRRERAASFIPAGSYSRRFQKIFRVILRGDREIANFFRLRQLDRTLRIRVFIIWLPLSRDSGKPEKPAVVSVENVGREGVTLSSTKMRGTGNSRRVAVVASEDSVARTFVIIRDAYHLMPSLHVGATSGKGVAGRQWCVNRSLVHAPFRLERDTRALRCRALTSVSRPLSYRL